MTATQNLKYCEVGFGNCLLGQILQHINQNIKANIGSQIQEICKHLENNHMLEDEYCICIYIFIKFNNFIFFFKIIILFKILGIII